MRSAISGQPSSFLHRSKPHSQQVSILGKVAVDVLSHRFVISVNGEIAVVNHFQTNGRLVVTEESDISTCPNTALGRTSTNAFLLQEISLGRLPDGLA